MTFLLPIEVQTSAKNFWNNGSNNYDSFSASQDTKTKKGGKIE